MENKLHWIGMVANVGFPAKCGNRITKFFCEFFSEFFKNQNFSRESVSDKKNAKRAKS